MCLIILAHSEFTLGKSEIPSVYYLELVLNVVGRAAVPLFLFFAGEHLGPRLLRDRMPGGVWPYVVRLGVMFFLASIAYWTIDLAKLVRAMGLLPGAAAFADRLGADPIRVMLYGARPHLWFLVVLSLTSLGVAGLLKQLRVRAVVLIAAALYGVGLAIGPYAPALGVTPQLWWYEWLLQSPLYFCLGVVVGLDSRRRPGVGTAVTVLLVGLVVHASEVYWITHEHGTSPFRLAMLLGTVIITAGAGMLALAPGATRVERLVARLGPLVPAVYLTHVFFIETFRPPRGRFPEIAVRIVLPLLSIVCAFGSAWLIGRLGLLRRRRRRRPAAADEPKTLERAASPEGP